ncbi:MAG: hypothetical protein KJI69_05175 [Patescibacteria group bacterium]|nr:hypothetical protein [Patescibacteria group bacterium]
MNKKLYAVVGRRLKIVGSGKKEREVLGKEHLIYSQAPGSGDCECSYTDDILWIFPTKKEALGQLQWPPYQYRKENCRVVRLEVNYK